MHKKRRSMILNPTDIHFQFDTENKTFQLGEKISGTIIVKPQSEVVVTDVEITFKWNATIENPPRRARYDEGLAEIIRFDQPTSWYPGKTYCYPFSLTAPNRPPTYKSKNINLFWEIGFSLRGKRTNTIDLFDNESLLQNGQDQKVVISSHNEQDKIVFASSHHKIISDKTLPVRDIHLRKQAMLFLQYPLEDYHIERITLTQPNKIAKKSIHIIKRLKTLKLHFPKLKAANRPLWLEYSFPFILIGSLFLLSSLILFINSIIKLFVEYTLNVWFCLLLITFGAVMVFLQKLLIPSLLNKRYEEVDLKVTAEPEPDHMLSFSIYLISKLKALEIQDVEITLKVIERIRGKLKASKRYSYSHRIQFEHLWTKPIQEALLAGEPWYHQFDLSLEEFDLPDTFALSYERLKWELTVKIITANTNLYPAIVTELDVLTLLEGSRQE